MIFYFGKRHFTIAPSTLTTKKMSCVVKGSDLPQIVSNGLPQFTKIIHYVYPDSYYNYRVCKGAKNIIADNEACLFSNDALEDLKLDRYPCSVKYFLFTKSMNTKVRTKINNGKATRLTLMEARKMHDYFLDLGMICVFPTIQRKEESGLFKKLLAESKRLAQPPSAEDYLRDALAPKMDIYPSFFYDEEKEEEIIFSEEQFLQVDAFLSNLKAKIQASMNKEGIREKHNENGKRERQEYDHDRRDYKKRRW